jgi:hypothetical protein
MAASFVNAGSARLEHVGEEHSERVQDRKHRLK